MTRKRFKKLLMAQGMSRNGAEDFCRVVKYVNSHPDVLKEALEERATKRAERSQPND